MNRLFLDVGKNKEIFVDALQVKAVVATEGVPDSCWLDLGNDSVIGVDRSAREAMELVLETMKTWTA